MPNEENMTNDDVEIPIFPFSINTKVDKKQIELEELKAKNV